jgi:hypothetical protein
MDPARLVSRSDRVYSDRTKTLQFDLGVGQ